LLIKEKSQFNLLFDNAYMPLFERFLKIKNVVKLKTLKNVKMGRE